MNSSAPRLVTFRLLWGIIIVLVLLNAALLTWLWMSPGRVRHPGGPGPDGAENFLAEELHFSPAQRTRFDSLRSTYFRQMHPLIERVHANRLNYFQLLDDTTLTDQQLAQRAAAGHATMTAVDVLTLRHFQQVAALCTPTQRKQLTQVLAELPMVRGGGPPERRGGRGPGQNARTRPGPPPF